MILISSRATVMALFLVGANAALAIECQGGRFGYSMLNKDLALTGELQIVLERDSPEFRSQLDNIPISDPEGWAISSEQWVATVFLDGEYIFGLIEVGDRGNSGKVYTVYFDNESSNEIPLPMMLLRQHGDWHIQQESTDVITAPDQIVLGYNTVRTLSRTYFSSQQVGLATGSAELNLVLERYSRLAGLLTDSTGSWILTDCADLLGETE
jgi:hypothetical protein